MTDALPARANLDWLRKTAKQHLRAMRAQRPEAKLAEAQFAVARQYGFSSWRRLKAHIDRLAQADLAASASPTDEAVASFLRDVGAGRLQDVQAALAAEPALVNAVGPHPFWGGRPQALHLSIETKRRSMFDLLVAAGADVDGSNDEYERCSPLMLTFHWDEPGMRQELMDRGARVGLVEAMLFEDDAAVEKMLRGKSALPKIAPNGGSLLAFARTPFAIDRLLALGAPADLKDRWGATPIEAMSRLGPRGRELVRHLAQKGVKAGPQEYARLGDQEALAELVGRNPDIARSEAVMMAAVDFGHCELVRWLLSHGADVSARAAWGSQGTALHSAAWNGDLEMVKLLVAAGADVLARDAEHNNTPAGFAQIAITVSNNPKCKAVVDYLNGLSASAT
jgi:hypothetical protein